MTDDRRRRFEQVYAVHRAAILGYALRRTGSADDAADVIAETSLAAWRRIDEMPTGKPPARGCTGLPAGCSPTSAAASTAGLRWANGSAPSSPRSRSTREPPPGSEGVAVAFRRLADSDREILTLAGWEGLDAGQIAVVLGCSRNAARIRLHRARRRPRPCCGWASARPASRTASSARPGPWAPAT